jgi:HSP20 family molecular chaperone IbpA
MERQKRSKILTLNQTYKLKNYDIRARHLNGVLEVTIPKVAAPEPKRVSVETH